MQEPHGVCVHKFQIPIVLSKLDFNLTILRKFKIEIAASSRNSGTPRNDTNALILLMLSLRAKRSNLLFWTTMKFRISPNFQFQITKTILAEVLILCLNPPNLSLLKGKEFSLLMFSLSPDKLLSHAGFSKETLPLRVLRYARFPEYTPDEPSSVSSARSVQH